MSSADIGAVLHEMRRVAAEAGLRSARAKAPADEGFQSALKSALSEVNHAQVSSKSMTDSFTLGEGRYDLPEVMVAQQKARISFEAVMQVRNRLVAAYEEVMNMPL